MKLASNCCRAEHQEQADEPFHDFRASKSVDRRLLWSSGSSCDWYWSSKRVKVKEVKKRTNRYEKIKVKKRSAWRTGKCWRTIYKITSSFNNSLTRQFEKMKKKILGHWICIVNLPARAFRHFRALKPVDHSFPNYIKFVDLRILRLQNCKRFGRIACCIAALLMIKVDIFLYFFAFISSSWEIGPHKNK